MAAQTVIIALGSNLGDRWDNLDRAVRRIESIVGPVLRRSTWIESEPLLDPADSSPQPAYLNGAILCSSLAVPAAIFQQLQAIEREFGRERQRSRRWAPRTIDLDIIGIDQLVIDQPGLIVPHPEMDKRTFVLEPLAEIWPDWIHPLIKKNAKELLADCRKETI